MAFLLAFGLALGVYLIYDGLTRPRLVAAPVAAPSGRLAGRIAKLLRGANVRGVTPAQFVAASAGTGLAALVVALLVTGWFVVGLAAGALGAGLPYAYFARREARRRAGTGAALVEALLQAVGKVRTGRSIQEALISLAVDGPPTLRPAFLVLGQRARVETFRGALDAWRDEVDDPLADTIAAQIAAVETLGTGAAQLADALEALGHAKRDALALQQMAREQQSGNVLQARAVVASPVLLLLILKVQSPELTQIYDTPTGQAILAACAVSLIIGYGALLRVVRVDTGKRVFR